VATNLSAWLAHLVGAYILENTQQLFKDNLFHGFYYDDGFAVFDGTYLYSYYAEWRNQFQTTVNALAEGESLQYTLAIWLDGTKRCAPLHEFDSQVSVVTDDRSLYLDMELKWGDLDDLQFQVHLKPKQQLKYLNGDSTHSTACFRATPQGVFNRLAKLPTITPNNENMTMRTIYPSHYNKLDLANLLHSVHSSTTLREQHQQYQLTTTTKAKSTKLWKKRDRKCSVYFCIGYSRAWIKPIHKIIKEIKSSLGISWLRVSISYHRFPDLRE
jgi:hypothetical protein